MNKWLVMFVIVLFYEAARRLGTHSVLTTEPKLPMIKQSTAKYRKVPPRSIKALAPLDSKELVLHILGSVHEHMLILSFCVRFSLTHYVLLGSHLVVLCACSIVAFNPDPQLPTSAINQLAPDLLKEI